MRKLEIKVNDLIMSKSGDYSNIVRGTDNYLVLHFNFDRTWKDRKKVVHIEDVEGESYNAIVDKTNSIVIPKKVTGTSKIFVTLHGKQNNSFVKTNTLSIDQL